MSLRGCPQLRPFSQTTQGDRILRKSLTPIAACLCLLVFASSAQAAHPNNPNSKPSPSFSKSWRKIGVGCAHAVTAKQAVGLAEAVWSPKRWQRGAPKAAAIAAHRRQVRCAAGPGHRAAIIHRWEIERHRFYEHRRYCSSGTVVSGRVSYFGGGLEASGHFTSEPGIALNIAPGTEGGWNNATTRGWLSKLQPFRVSIAGHSAILPVTDLGPAGFTQRSIDVTEGGVDALHLVGAFPTDAIGTAQSIPPGCF